MSSFLCQKETILNAASARALCDEWHPYHGTFEECIVQLAALNAAGMNARYGYEDDTRMWEASMEHAGRVTNRDPLKAYKALRCVLYQAMEGDVPESEPFKFWDKISTQLAHKIASDAADEAGIGWDS